MPAKIKMKARSTVCIGCQSVGGPPRLHLSDPNEVDLLFPIKPGKGELLGIKIKNGAQFEVREITMNGDSTYTMLARCTDGDSEFFGYFASKASVMANTNKALDDLLRMRR